MSAGKTDQNQRLYDAFARADQRRPAVIAHLGQSVDGFIATGTGDSYYVTGSENLDHLHRMRALADAVIVGAGTIAADDPALTTRRVPGDNPIRVVLDGRRRLHSGYQVFQDAAAPTLLICGADRGATSAHGNAEVVVLPQVSGRCSAAGVIAALTARGMAKIFIEGGGTVVSEFVASGVVDRLQLGIAPVLIGHGRRGIVVPAQARMRDCMRPPFSFYRMGEDVMYDYDLRAARSGSASRSQ